MHWKCIDDGYSDCDEDEDEDCGDGYGGGGSVGGGE